MATQKKRKNAADHGSMKINKYFKPLKKTAVHVPSESNDENLPPQGQSTEKKKVFGEQSLNKAKPMKTPLKDRNPEVRISTSQNSQNNRVSFSVLRDDDIKNGVAKAPQPEHKETKVIQSSQPSSQTGSAHSSQSNSSQKDDFISKIKPKKLFTVFIDNQGEQEDKQGQSSQTSCPQQENAAIASQQKHFSIYHDGDIADAQSQSSETSSSQQEISARKQKPFSVFMDSHENDDDQSSQTSCSQPPESVPFKQKPFSIFIDKEEEGANQNNQMSYSRQENMKQKAFSIFMDNENESIQSNQSSYFQKEQIAPKRKPFSVLIDNTNDGQNESDQTNHPQGEVAPKKKLFSVFADNDSEDESSENRQDLQQQENTFPKSNAAKQLSIYVDSKQDEQIQSSQKKTVHKKKPKKLFSVYNENQPAIEDSEDDDTGFLIFTDNNEVDDEFTTKPLETRVLRDKTKEVASGNIYSATDGFFDDDNEFENDDPSEFLTHTRQSWQTSPKEEELFHVENTGFFSDDRDSDSYSESVTLYDDNFSTACEPLPATDSNKLAEAHDASNSDSNLFDSDSKDTNDTTPDKTHNNILEPSQSIGLAEDRTLSLSYSDPVEEVHEAYPNPRADSLHEKLGLTEKNT